MSLALIRRRCRVRRTERNEVPWPRNWTLAYPLLRQSALVSTVGRPTETRVWARRLISVLEKWSKIPLHFLATCFRSNKGSKDE